MTPDGKDLDLLHDLIAKAKAAGAEAADAVIFDSISLAHAQRLGALERLEREESRDLGLRVLIGKRQAIVSSTDLSAEALDELAARAVAMARSVPEDPYCGLAEPEQLAGEIPALDICDAAEPAPEALIERARACEAARAWAWSATTNSPPRSTAPTWTTRRSSAGEPGRRRSNAWARANPRRPRSAWSSTRAWRTVCSGIWWARSPARRWRAAPRS
jgi:hypothetical protein